MFTIDCNACGNTHLVSAKHIQSTHRTNEGLIAYVKCTLGHTVIHRMAPAYPPPPAPASVLAFRKKAESSSAVEEARPARPA